MTLQNRVDPFGIIHAVPDRGLFTGNRGIIHDPATKRLTRRRWTTKAWIICECAFGGRRRQVMGPGANGRGSWTELFFLDEVTALAAGHRPCFYCRRQAALEFSTGIAAAGGTRKIMAPEIDARLHAERLAAGARPDVLRPSAIRSLPDGAMIAIDGKPHAIRRGKALAWSFAGYGDDSLDPFVKARIVTHITPATTREALTAGYQPVWHETACP